MYDRVIGQNRRSLMNEHDYNGIPNTLINGRTGSGIDLTFVSQSSLSLDIMVSRTVVS